ncbi:MAG: glucose-1-phosphate cytidylyltransferase [Opitutae bacterium]|nr:glucose-1-phosphate cytidylyltransferase [Opitutae bacterium]
MKVVILCGGKGTRLREETEYRPKPMVPVGNRPILWHIMKIYAAFGHRDFILCLGYKGEMIKDFFRNYQWHTCDATLSLGRGTKVTFNNRHTEENWKVTLAETGENAMTAYRIRQIKRYIGRDQTFLLTYGDGVGNVDIAATIRQHRQSKAVCTMTAVHPPGRFGELSLDVAQRVVGFNEKPQTVGGYINGGFMVCDRAIFDYLPDDPGMMLEQQPMKELTRDGKLGAYLHEGFWQPMDTFQEFTLLNRLWEGGEAPWKIW